jgi:HTH-type transcriptional repressor of NAD biosynthesis genes
MSRGIVIGKFYPPHKGHKYLIYIAKSKVKNLTVIVCERHDQTIPGQLRADWLREMCPGVNVIVVNDILCDEDSKAWAQYTLQVLGFKPDIVFTSEEYGDAYASRMGAQHILVDRDRAAVPISGTEIRARPLKNWDSIEPCVRAYYAKRVCVLGAESTGTTTMAKTLTEYYKTTGVTEFGRIYSEAKIQTPGSLEWRTEEFTFIAEQQNRIEDELVKTCNKILVCDTNSFATCLWHERYMGFWSSNVEALAENRKCDMYLLTCPDIPFVQDGTRYGEHIRLDMHRRFEEELNKRNMPFVILSGGHESRTKKAIEVCENILKE